MNEFIGLLFTSYTNKQSMQSLVDSPMDLFYRISSFIERNRWRRSKERLSMDYQKKLSSSSSLSSSAKSSAIAIMQLLKIVWFTVLSLGAQLEGSIELPDEQSNQALGEFGLDHIFFPKWEQNLLHRCLAKKVWMPFSPKSVGPKLLLILQIAGSVSSKRHLLFFSPIEPIAALQIANNKAPIWHMVRKVRKCLQQFALPVVSSEIFLKPSSIACKFCKITDKWLHNVFSTPVRSFAPFVEIDFFTALTTAVPLFCSSYCSVHHLTIKLKIFSFPYFVLGFKAF